MRRVTSVHCQDSLSLGDLLNLLADNITQSWLSSSLSDGLPNVREHLGLAECVKDSGFSPILIPLIFYSFSIYSSYFSFMHAFAVSWCLL